MCGVWCVDEEKSDLKREVRIPPACSFHDKGQIHEANYARSDFSKPDLRGSRADPISGQVASKHPSHILQVRIGVGVS